MIAIATLNKAFCIVQCGVAHTTRFQCQSSSDSNGLVYTPNIPDFYFNDSNAANFGTDGSGNLTQSLFRRVAYIFTIPQSQLHNYSDTVVSLQYCYQATNNNIDNNRTINVFAFLLLTQNGMNFTVSKQILIGSTPSKSICTVPSGSIQQICCDNTTLRTTDQFQLPSSNFSFGVAIRNPNIRPLVITTSSTRTVEQYVTLVGLTNPGTMFTLASNEKVNDNTLLFRFSIGSYYS